MHRFLEKKFIGSFMMVSTAVFFSAMALFVRLASETIPVGMIIFTRFTVSTAFIVVLYAAGTIRIRPVNHRLLIARALAASIGGVFYFFAVSTITIAEAVILKYTYPLFAVTFAAVLFGEKTDRTVLGLLSLSIAGVVIMMNPASFNPQAGYVWGLLNGLFAGGAVAFVRKLRDTDNAGTIMFATSLMGVIVSLPFLAGGMMVPEGIELAWLGLASGCGLLAQFSLVYGIRYIKTGSACIIMMLEVVLSSALGFIVLGHTMGLIKIIGGIIVLAGGFVLIRREGK